MPARCTSEGRSTPLAGRRSSSASADDRADRSSDHSGVEAKALMTQVKELVLQLLQRVSFRAGVAVLHLRPAGQSRPYPVAEVVERDLAGELTHVMRLLGAGADDGQVATEDVHDLRQLIEMGTAHEVAERSDPRVVLTRPFIRQGVTLGSHG